MSIASDQAKLVSDVKEKLMLWASPILAEKLSSGIYVFGSLIRRGGTQFNEGSDLDLVVVIPEEVDTPSKRVAWTEEMARCIRSLELDLMMLLKRNSAAEAITSVVAVTSLEVEGNIHKDGTTAFFSSNTFMDLRDGNQLHGLPNVGTKAIARLETECLKFAQKQRNEFLSIGPNGTQRLRSYDGDDPLPKSIMRHGAMAKELHKPTGIAGAETDTQFGLDFLAYLLYDLADISENYAELQNTLSVRRAARGIVGPVSPVQQLMLSEIIFDIAAKSHFKKEKTSTVTATPKAKTLPSINGMDSTVFFSDRFSQAFPGVRTVKIYDDPNDIKQRLNRLFMEPLVFAETTPIWWWRNGNLQIYRFKDLGNGDYLMNDEELRIKKIAAVYGGQYFRSFVYIEACAMEPTGLYESTPERIEANRPGQDGFGYYWEEYGIVDGKHLVTAGEAEDGAAMIDGELQDTLGRTEKRTRYVTPYNFVVAAHGSPINNPDFDADLEKILNGMLGGTSTIDELVEAIQKLPKRH